LFFLIIPEKTPLKVIFLRNCLPLDF
jgi:hypothetical protein